MDKGLNVKPAALKLLRGGNPRAHRAKAQARAEQDSKSTENTARVDKWDYTILRTCPAKANGLQRVECVKLDFMLGWG